MHKVKIGILGAGAIAERAHIAHYVKLEHVELSAIADLDQNRAEQVAEKFGIPNVYTNVGELLARRDIDGVSICTPNKFHADHSIAAMKAGKHVLVEKPMCMNLQEAEEMICTSKMTGKALMVSFTHRFFSHNQYVKEQLEEGTIGTPLTFRIRFAHLGPYTSWEAKSGWFFNKELSGGGALLDMGIHALDLLRYFGGEFKEIKGYAATLKHNIEVEDYAAALIAFESGTYGHMETGWYSQPGFTGYEIYGTEGTIICDYQTVRILREVDGVKQWVERPTNGDPWVTELRFFTNAILSGSLSHSTAEDGRKALEWVLKLYE